MSSPLWGMDAIMTGGTSAIPSAFHRRPSSGAPLDAATRATMEPRFAYDFSNVRVHTGSDAASSAQSIGARAYTVGSDVVFGPGQFRPDAEDGRGLIAHELAHVVHNDAASAMEPRISRQDEPSERAANVMARAALAGVQRSGAPPGPSSVPALQRQRSDLTPPDLMLRRSPWFLRSMGRLVIDGFVTGQSSLSEDQRGQIAVHGATLRNLLEMEPGGRITVTGHGDAVGTETCNQELGLARAEAVRVALVDAGVPPERIDIDSAGESDPAVASPSAEARNRRAVIGFSPALRVPGFGGPGLQLPSLTPRPTPDRRPTPDLRLHRDPMAPITPIGTPSPLPPWSWRPIPPAPPRTSDGLRDFFERDPLLRLLPQPFRNWALSGLERTPEAIASVIADQVPLEGEAKEAAAATLRALARHMMGQSWSPPPNRDPRFDMPPAQPFPSVPGQTIIPLPGIPLDPNFKPKF